VIARDRVIRKAKPVAADLRRLAQIRKPYHGGTDREKKLPLINTDDTDLKIFETQRRRWDIAMLRPYGGIVGDGHRDRR
jgi:hypothetical protein